MSATATATRVRVRVEGTVQGVGFRPYVYRLATELGLSGHVLNDAHGVIAEVEAPDRGAIDAFLGRLRDDTPPLAHIERVSVTPVSPRHETGFRIAASSELRTAPSAAVTPDSATCAACVRELFDPEDRRFRYPFINCTDCGPRFTIVRGVPYDRPLTTMAAFAMCARCRAEYEDPADRRFHAQPNACPECGPRVRLLGANGAEIDHVDPIRVAASAIVAGSIVAVKGLGGYHLACRADDEAAVSRLRARKHREEKPFALMVRDLAAAEALADLDPAARDLLTSPARPIVLAPRRAGSELAASVAPRLPELGLMLPYTPLHHLLLADLGSAIVLTSGNASEEPIAFRDGDALTRLRGIADLFLVHDRPIHTRTDDSVVRTGRSARPQVLRRSRGYVPAALTIPAPDLTPDILACGAELKNTFCVTRGQRAWVSHHIGDLANAETLAAFTEGIEHFTRLFAVRPVRVAHDLHPDLLSTRYALAREDLEPVAVQHHHAHMAAVLAEHFETGPAVGVSFDGTGYGSDGTVWGGEILAGDIGDVTRVGSLHPVRMPGGEQAIRQPWRMACAWLVAAGAGGEPPEPLAARVGAERWHAVARLVHTGLASPTTTSVGRLFDAIAALAGVRAEIAYEGQAAIELEAACDVHERGVYPLPVHEMRLDARETILAAAHDARAGVAPGVIAARFHAALAAATVAAALAAAEGAGTETAVLCGGVFANRRLLAASAAGLERAGMRVLVPQRLPCGDGGIAYGQAAVAAWRGER